MEFKQIYTIFVTYVMTLNKLINRLNFSSCIMAIPMSANNYNKSYEKL